MNDVDKIRNFIVENFLFGDDERLREDTSFLEEGIIDSTGIIELVTFLEETYDFHIDDDELIPENLDSLRRIAQFLQWKLADRPTAASTLRPHKW